MIKKYTYYLLSIVLLSHFVLGSNVKTTNNLPSTRIDLISSDIYNTNLLSKVENYSIIELENNKHKVIIDNGTPIIELGAPDLPKITTSIIIPDNGNMSISIINVEYEEVRNIKIAPSKGNLTRDINPASIPYTFGKVYKKDEFYPGNLAELSDPYILRDIRGQSVIFYPIQYNPFTQTLRVYKTIEIAITSNGVSDINVLSRSENKIKSSKEFSHIYDNLFINSQTDTRFEFLDDYGSMLIICYDDFIDEMEVFVDWKNKKGIRTDIVGVNEIGSSVSQIQAFIEDYYYDNNLVYLLLVGDVAQIPTPIINGASADPSYGFLEGNDSFAEVIVGRFSANNPSHLTTQIQRSLDYEQNPPITEHFDNALGIASNQGPGYGGLSDDDFNTLIWDDFLSTFTYDSYEGIYDPNGSVSDGMYAINNGVGIINYTGHAGPTGWGNGAALGVNDVHQLENTNKLPFIFTVGCNPGEFNNYDECFCEAWMRATDDDGNPTGAIGHVGSTISQSWEPPMHGQWAMNSILTESYDGNISRSFGGIAVNGCMHMNEAQGSYGINETNHWTIFGDPSITIRTDEPEVLNVSYNNAIFVGQTEFVVDVGIDNVLGAISIDDELLISAISSGGVMVFDLSEIVLEPGEVDLVLTSFNTIPHQATINVAAPDGAYLVFDSYTLINDSNDMIEYGEDIDLQISVENIGNFNASAITVNVTSDDEYISMINGESMIAYAIMNQVATTEGSPVSFSISNSVPDNHVAQFQVLLSNGEDEDWQFSFGVLVHAPVFQIDNLVFEDAGMDGVWDPGETATITLDLINSGSTSFNQYPGATISINNDYVNILSGENDNTFYGIGPNSSYEGIFIVEALESSPMNTQADFNISWGYSPTSECEGDCVEQENMTYSVIIGHPSILIWDPSNNHYSGQRLVDYFDNVGISGFDYIISTEAPDVENYLTAFIFLGIYVDNYVLQENDVTGFMNFLNNGGNLYLEGSDTWAFDMQTSLQSMFGLMGVSDGTADLNSVVGSEGSFAEGLYMSYTGGNSYIDQLAATDGFALLENDVANYITAVAYDNEVYRTIGASHELGGLQGDDFDIYVNGILEFFDEGSGNTNPDPECNIGDINDDGMVDVTDIIRIVNIIINDGMPPTDVENCAGDVNVDGEVNVLDVLVMINIILDTQRERLYPVEEVGVILDSDKIIINSEGNIKGIQFLIESAGELVVNPGLNMDIAYNKIHNYHYGLIYSLEGNSINGDFTLLDITDDYIVKELILANSQNQIIEILYEDISIPSAFILKQNYPNPFNPSTTIDIVLGQNEYIKLAVYNLFGNQINVIANGNYQSGNYSFIWDGKNSNGVSVSSGMYIYSLIGNKGIESKSMILLK